MTGEDDEIDWDAFDHVVLQVFEEQEDRSGVLTYPLTSQRQALDFIKLMNRKGLPYQQMCDTIGEKPETFRSWRLGNGNSHVGNAMMRRINRTIQETMNMPDVERDQVLMESDSFFDDIDSDPDHDPDGGLSSLEDGDVKEGPLPNGELEHEPSSAPTPGKTEIAGDGSGALDVVDEENKCCSSKAVIPILESAACLADQQQVASMEDESRPDNSVSEKNVEELVVSGTSDVTTEPHPSENDAKSTPNCSVSASLPNAEVKPMGECETLPESTSHPSEVLESLSSVATSTVECDVVDSSSSLIEQSPVDEISHSTDDTRLPPVVDVVDEGTLNGQPSGVDGVESEAEQSSDHVVDNATVETAQSDAACHEVPVAAADTTITISDDSCCKHNIVNQTTESATTRDETETETEICPSVVPIEQPSVVEEEPKVKYEVSTKQLDLMSRLAMLKERAAQRKSAIAEGEATASSSSDSSVGQIVDESGLKLDKSETKPDPVPKATEFSRSVNVLPVDAGFVSRPVVAERPLRSEELTKSCVEETSLITSCDSRLDGSTTKTSGGVEKVVLIDASRETIKDVGLAEVSENTGDRIDKTVSQDSFKMRSIDSNASQVGLNVTSSALPSQSTSAEGNGRPPENLKMLEMSHETVLGSIQNKTEVSCGPEKYVVITNKDLPCLKDASNSEVANVIDTTVKSSALDPRQNHNVTAQSKIVQEPLKKTNNNEGNCNQEKSVSVLTKDAPCLTDNISSEVENVIDTTIKSSALDPHQNHIIAAACPQDVAESKIVRENSQNIINETGCNDERQGKSVAVANKKSPCLKDDSSLELVNEINTIVKSGADEERAHPQDIVPSKTVQENSKKVKDNEADCSRNKAVLTANLEPPCLKVEGSSEVKHEVVAATKTVADEPIASMVQPTTCPRETMALNQTKVVPDSSQQTPLTVKEVQASVVGFDDKTKGDSSTVSKDKRPIDCAPPSIEPVPTPAAVTGASSGLVRDAAAAAAAPVPCKRGKSGAAVRRVDVVLDNTFDGSVTLNYDSDLDIAGSNEKTYALIDRVRKLKSSPVEGAGFLYVFTDSSPENELCRFKVGVSRFPGKRLQQAMCFNPEIRSFAVVAVTRRLEALRIVRQKLEEFKVVGTIDWFACSDDVITCAVDEVSSEVKS